MFPTDSNTNDYDEKMLTLFQEKIKHKNYSWNLKEILPKVLLAGENAGTLTSEGLNFLDPSKLIKNNIEFCPPEGDAGTGMVATNAVAIKTGNVSAGTSIFAMIVLNKALKKLHKEIDIVTTPDGKPVAMVHCNNCCSDLDAWIKLFHQFSSVVGVNITKPQIYDLLYEQALSGSPDCAGLVSFNSFSGEHITNTTAGRHLFTRKPASNFSLKNFM